jgi:hypothetical protein
MSLRRSTSSTLRPTPLRKQDLSYMHQRIRALADHGYGIAHTARDGP